ncbi:MAG: hypothetical protein CMH34_02385 [Microbacterium sp.]|nr:hypothetical protein [Microbacterium sp.]|tara:strand:+ start:369 stop:578 length:210 start_codon:yes stop_codon:yes gene_type:complete
MNDVLCQHRSDGGDLLTADFVELIGGCQQELFRFAGRRLPEQSSAEDAVAETHAAAWTLFRRGKPISRA